MRWQQLFADLEAQFDEAAAASERAEEASRARLEMGGVRLSERLSAALGHPVTLRCRGAGQVAGVLTDLGVDWLLLEEDGGRELLVASRAVVAVAGLGRHTAAPGSPGAFRSRFDLRRAIRVLARDRATVQVVLDDGGVFGGTVDRVGADHLELAEHAVEEPRRGQNVQGVRAVVIDAVALLRILAPPML
jgi:hypothetical protein